MRLALYYSDPHWANRNSSQGCVSQNQRMKPRTRRIPARQKFLASKHRFSARGGDPKGLPLKRLLSPLYLLKARSLSVPLSDWFLAFLQHFILHLQEKHSCLKTSWFFVFCKTFCGFSSFFHPLPCLPNPVPNSSHRDSHSTISFRSSSDAPLRAPVFP